MWTAAGTKKGWPSAGMSVHAYLGGSGVSAIAEGRRVKSAHCYKTLATLTLLIIIFWCK
jgi:hypothetical protein